MTDTSMSAIQSYLKCQRSYFYKYVRGLRPLREATDKMDLGTLFHAGAAAGYLALKQPRPGTWTMYAYDGVDAVMENGYDYHGERRQLEVKEEDVELVREMLEYYWNEVGSKDVFDEILAVEEPFTLEIGGYSIRNTFDLVVREGGRVVVYDHKTVGNVKESAEFLPLDFQVGAYMVAASRHFGEPVEFVYNMVRRAVPKELTKSGRKSTASKDVNDYLRRERLWKNETELKAWEATLEMVVSDIDTKKEDLAGTGLDSWYLRNATKGYMGCLGCAYKSICSAELTGQKLNDDFLSLTYRIPEAA